AGTGPARGRTRVRHGARGPRGRSSRRPRAVRATLRPHGITGGDMTYEQIVFETKEGVGWIRLNRPEKLNALTHHLSGEALDALETCQKDSEVRCVVITGVGRGFGAGQDLKEVQDEGLE